MTDEKIPPQGVVDLSRPLRLLREVPDAACNVTGAAIVEWHDGDHSHLVFEIMTIEGWWEPLAAVSLQDCRANGMRKKLRQFPVFRLAWYGQVGEPSTTPQLLVPEHDKCASSDATTLP